ncbi:MAG: winged helix-turn-helix domain-containing protein [Rhizobiaceae bacterium]
MPKLMLKIDVDPEGRIGPGKIALLEQIAANGSISAAARAMEMSYKRAWDLVGEMNRIFGKPVIAAKTGGHAGGGASLTPVGAALVERFRAIEQTALDATRSELEALQAEIDAS